MAVIISIANQKGGVGKTTVTAMLANALAGDPFGYRVYVADCDAQQSLIRRRLADQRDRPDDPAPYKIEHLNIATLQKEIPVLDKQNDFVFIDLPGRLDSTSADDQHTIAKYLQYIDILLLPFTPGNYSLESTLDYLRFVMKVRQQRSTTPRPLVLIGFVNMYEGRTLDDRILMEEIADLQTMVNVPFIISRLQRFALFRNVDTFTSFYDPTTTDKAKANFSTFFKEVKDEII
jgi:cellulose biosynthesis protein BcsQ